MRSAIAAMTLTLTLSLVPGQLHAATKKMPKPDVGSGRVAWFDITTTDLVHAKEFYGKLFSWQFTEVKGTDRAAQIVAGGTEVGTIRVADGKISSFNGVVYVQVEDIMASCKKAKELGGVIPPGFPFNLSDGAGAIAIVADPSGHPLGMYSRTPLPPATPAK